MTKNTKIRNIDSESRKSRVTIKNKGKSQRKLPGPESPESSSDEYISQQSDSELEQELDMPAKDDSRKKLIEPKKSRKRGEKDTAAQSAPHATKESKEQPTSVATAPHMIMRASVYHMRLAPITFPKASTYVPSFYQFFFCLNSAQKIVVDNSYLERIAPNYLSIATSLYYGYLGIIQILRAKVIAGIATKVELQAIRRFERQYPFESLPVMSPLIMFFQNLGAVKLSDPMYSWICPTLPTQIGTAANVNGIFANNLSIMLPNIPALIRFLYEIGTSQELEQVTDGNNRLVPASRVSANNNFFGINLAAAQQNEVNFQRLVYSAGILLPPELPSSMDVSTIRRIARWQLPELTSATDLQSVGSFLQIDGDIEWFKELINMATQEAKFFRGSTNFANISPTSGLSSLIEIKIKSTKLPKAIDEFYPFSSDGFSSDIWKFKGETTRGETSPEETQIGSTSQFLMVDYNGLTPNGHAVPTPTLDGSYFLPNFGGRQVIQIETDTTRTPRLAFEQIIRENLYDETGGQHN